MIETLKTFYCDPKEISVREGLDRYRKDIKKLRKLQESIETFGQLQPILVTNMMELIAGGRRLAACMMAQIDVLCIKRDDVSDLELRELEIEENLQREDLTPAEEVLAVADLHKHKQERHGKSVSGREGGWTLAKTAEIISKEKGTVIEAIKLAETIKEFPELRTSKTKSDIKKAVMAIQRTVLRAQKAEEYENSIKELKEKIKVFHGDAIEYIKTLETDSIDLLLTDPLYEINADKSKRGIGDVPGGLSQAGYKIDDSSTDFLVLRQIAIESIRITKLTSHAYVFVAPEYFQTVREIFISAGWNCYIKPLIWYKPNAGQCNLPLKWPASSYEMILFCRRIDSKLIKLGQSDVLTYSTITGTKKLHDYEKPVELLQELIQRTSYPNEVLFDPFMGGGSSIIAGMRQKLICFGCDIDKDAYNATLSRISEEVDKDESD